VRGGRLRPIAVAGVVAATLVSGPASAQSPSPTSTFKDYSPSPKASTSSHFGVIVEGTGSLTCATALPYIESRTVTYINRAVPTITEISPQPGCGSISQYESLFTNLTNYVESNASNPGRFWGGIMLDEESSSGWFTASQDVTLNNALRNTMLGTPGHTWWYTENFSGTNTWSEATWNNITNDSWSAPQIYTSYMKTLVNNAQDNNQIMVTWDTGMPAPYNTESYSDGAIGGQPFNVSFGFATTYYWDNQFTTCEC
jgi:hypothetical protein